MLTRKIRALLLSLVTLCALCVLPSHAFASTYNKDDDSRCGYSSDCANSDSNPDSEFVSSGGNSSGSVQASSDGANPDTNSSNNSNPVRHFVSQVYHGAKNIVRHLPKPIIYSFPYVLFVLLGLNILLLLFQVKRELSKYEALLARFEREKVATESKRTLMELVAHYLRTPLTVINGGIDMLGEVATTAASATALERITKHLQGNIELLITQMYEVDSTVVTSDDTTQARASAAFWRQPGLFAPLILIAVVVLSFDYLVEQSGRLNAGQVIFATHVIIYTALAVVLYQAFWRLQLRRRDRAAIERIVKQERATNQTRDNIVDKALALLESDLNQLDNTAASIGTSAARKFVQDGQVRFHELLTTLKVATTLRGSHSLEPYVQTQPSTLLAAVLKDLQTKANSKAIHIDIHAVDDATFVQSLELLQFALHTVLDNAIAYSPEGSSIAVTATSQAEQITYTVTDHGLGVTADKQSYLFQPFSKAEGAETFTHEGMGFSLYLARLIMMYVDGSIELSSEPNQGTEVVIHISTKSSAGEAVQA